MPSVRGVWKRVLSLAWPVMAEQTLRTLMRTVDIVVTATFSPVAVAAIGLADLYARFPLRVGLGLGGGAIALSSQDTGAGADATRDQAVSQALLIAVLAGLPFVAFGVLLGEWAIGALNAPGDVARLGGAYLAIVLATAPARHVALVAARALQGTGDTRTPMYVNVVANSLNILGSVTLGLGLFGAPRLEIVGVGIATAAANVLTACGLLAMLWSARTAAGLVAPRGLVVTKQLVVVSAPKVAEGFVATLAEFPFNAILLGFGTPVNAGFQIGRRMYQQVTGPLSRGYNVAANVVVGQALGEGLPGDARFNGWSVAALGLCTVGVIGVVLAGLADSFVRLFASDPATVHYAVRFAQVYGLSAAFLVAFSVLSGALQGASETRVPFLARTTGMFGGFLGVTYLGGVTLGYGPLAAYAGIAAAYLWMALVAAWGFRYGDWATRAADMMAERAGTVE